MHGAEVDPELAAYISGISDGASCAISVQTIEPLDGGHLMTLRGDGNLWETDDETSHVCGHHDDRDHTMHLSAGLLDGWWFACLSEQSRLSGVADAEPDCHLTVWLARTEGREGPDRIREEYGRALMESVQGRLWEAANLLASVPSGTPVPRGMVRNASAIMRRMAGA